MKGKRFDYTVYGISNGDWDWRGWRWCMLAKNLWDFNNKRDAIAKLHALRKEEGDGLNHYLLASNSLKDGRFIRYLNV